MAIRYLATPEILELHRQLMERFEQPSTPLRSEDLLESAALKPQMAAHYGGADVVEQAAQYAIGISQNQPFVDGNKRTGYVAMITFLALNGLEVEFRGDEIAVQLVAVAEREDSLDAATERFTEWLRARVVETLQEER